MGRKAMHLTDEDRSSVIEMAWQDRVPFDAIQDQFGLSETEVIELMRCTLKSSSFVMWRKRVTGRHAKHAKLSGPGPKKFMAYQHAKNKPKPTRPRQPKST